MRSCRARRGGRSETRLTRPLRLRPRPSSFLPQSRPSIGLLLRAAGHFSGRSHSGIYFSSCSSCHLGFSWCLIGACLLLTVTETGHCLLSSCILFPFPPPFLLPFFILTNPDNHYTSLISHLHLKPIYITHRDSFCCRRRIDIERPHRVYDYDSHYDYSDSLGSQVDILVRVLIKKTIIPSCLGLICTYLP